MSYRRIAVLAVAVVPCLLLAAPVHKFHPRIGPANAVEEWLQFSVGGTEGTNPRSSSVSTSNVSQLSLMWHFVLPESADGSPVYVANVLCDDDLVHNLLIFSTTKGRVVALDAFTGLQVWATVPPDGPRWTTSSPAIDPNRKWVYSYGLDGYLHKYLLANGYESFGAGWPELITLKGEVEKVSSALEIVTAKDGHRYLYCPTAAYPEPGDDGDYQGHLTTIDLDSGEQHVFNAACSDRDVHFDSTGIEPGDCGKRQSGIWARSGVAYDPKTDRIFVTTGNGVFDAHTGGYNWGDSVVALHPDGSAEHGVPVDSYTPVDYQRLMDEDLDLSSTTVAILPLPANTKLPTLGVQSGKDWLIRLLNLENLSGEGGPRNVGGEIQLLKVPQGGEVTTRPATWLDGTNHTWVFIATWKGLSGLQMVVRKGVPQLVPRWTRKVGGASPVIVNGVL